MDLQGYYLLSKLVFERGVWDLNPRLVLVPPTAVFKTAPISLSGNSPIEQAQGDQLRHYTHLLLKCACLLWWPCKPLSLFIVSPDYGHCQPKLSYFSHAATGFSCQCLSLGGDDRQHSLHPHLEHSPDSYPLQLPTPLHASNQTSLCDSAPVVRYTRPQNCQR